MGWVLAEVEHDKRGAWLTMLSLPPGGGGSALHFRDRFI